MRVAEETVWLTQKLIAALFEVAVPTVNEHLANLYSQGEITKGATIRNFRTVQKEGNREVARNVDFYNLDAIIGVGFRVNSARAIQFRQWATAVLRDFAIRGYPRKAFRDMNHYVRVRMIKHLERRSQRPYKLPEGQTYYQHLSKLGLGFGCP